MTIKVVSLNLWWGGELFPAALDFLRKEDADVVALQEVHDGHGPGLKDQQRSMEVLRRELGYPHDVFTQAYRVWMPEGIIPMGNAVLSKYPITEQPTTFLVESTRDVYQDVPEQWPIFPRILQHVKLDTPAGPANVYNMHGVWDLDGDRASPERRQMMARTLAAIDGRSNVILTGDTNATLGNPIWQDLEKELASVFGRELTTTFNMRRKDQPGYATAAVDHLYVSPGIQVVAKACPDVDISDHFPLVARLRIPAKS